MEHKGWFELPPRFRNQIKQGDWINLSNPTRRALIAKLTRLSGDANQVSVAAAPCVPGRQFCASFRLSFYARALPFFLMCSATRPLQLDDEALQFC